MGGGRKRGRVGADHGERESLSGRDSNLRGGGSVTRLGEHTGMRLAVTPERMPSGATSAFWNQKWYFASHNLGNRF